MVSSYALTCAAILRIPIYDQRIKYFCDDYRIHDTEHMTYIIEANEIAKNSGISRLVSLVDRFEIILKSSVTANIKKISGAKYWEIGSQVYPVANFITIVDMGFFLFGNSDVDSLRLADLSISQFERLVNNSHTREISFAGPNSALDLIL